MNPWGQSADVGTPPPTRVFIADDEQMLADALTIRLAQAEGIAVVGRLRVGELSLAEVAASEAEILLIDVEPLGNRVENVLSPLRMWLPTLSVIVLTASTVPAVFDAALAVGVAGWLTKSCRFEELVMAIRYVRDGGSWFAPRA